MIPPGQNGVYLQLEAQQYGLKKTFFHDLVTQ
jgi:hypothetical protein